MKPRITKAEYYARGAMENPALFRKATKSGAWTYGIITDYLN